MPAGTALAADFPPLHRTLVAAAGATTFASATVATGLLAASALATLVDSAAAAPAVAVFHSLVACHNKLLSLNCDFKAPAIEG